MRLRALVVAAFVILSAAGAGSAVRSQDDDAAARGLRNGEGWPPGFRPYAAGSPWNRRLPAAPRLAPRSAEMIASAYGGKDEAILRTAAPGGWDYTHPMYYARPDDPLVHTACNIYCRGVPAVGDIRIPAKARPAQGSDHHLAVVEPDGTEIDFWEATMTERDGRNSGANDVTRDWRSGDTLYYGGGGRCSNLFSGSGFQREGGPTAGGACLGGGRITAAEVRAGVAHHALFVALRCVGDGERVTPANQALHGHGGCAGEPRRHIPLGARIWSDLTERQVDALRLGPAATVYLKALHAYGAYVLDVRSGCERCEASEGALLTLESFEPPQEEWSYGRQPVDVLLGRALGWHPVQVARRGEGSDVGDLTPRYIGASPWRPYAHAGGAVSHLHVVDPCYASGEC